MFMGEIHVTIVAITETRTLTTGNVQVLEKGRKREIADFIKKCEQLSREVLSYEIEIREPSSEFSFLSHFLLIRSDPGTAEHMIPSF